MAGRLDLCVLLLDKQPVDPVGAPPPGQIDILDLAPVIAHIGHLPVQVVAHQPGQGDMQRDEYHGKRRHDPQEQSVAAFHGGPVRA